DPQAPLLQATLDGLGTVVHVVTAPAGLDVAVARPVIHDPTAPPPLERGDVVLAVGTPADSPRAAELVAHAGEAGAAAVVFKLEGPAPATLLQAAEQARVALLAAPPP